MEDLLNKEAAIRRYWDVDLALPEECKSLVVLCLATHAAHGLVFT
jgi:hypothetical protein